MSKSLKHKFIIGLCTLLLQKDGQFYPGRLRNALSGIVFLLPSQIRSNQYSSQILTFIFKALNWDSSRWPGLSPPGSLTFLSLWPWCHFPILDLFYGRPKRSSSAQRPGCPCQGRRRTCRQATNGPPPPTVPPGAQKRANDDLGKLLSWYHWMKLWGWGH